MKLLNTFGALLRPPLGKEKLFFIGLWVMGHKAPPQHIADPFFKPSQVFLVN